MKIGEQICKWSLSSQTKQNVKNAKRKKENDDKHTALTFMSHWPERERETRKKWGRLRKKT